MGWDSSDVVRFDLGLSYCLLALVSCLSDGYNLDRFSNALGLGCVYFLYFTDGPWYAWFIAVVIVLVVFVILYLISMQYAETVLATKFRRVDDDVEMAATKKSVDKKPGL